MSNFGTTEFYLEIAKGNIHEHSGVMKFGVNPDLSLNTWEDVWDAGGTYLPPTSVQLHDVVSTSAGDAGAVITSGAATGGSQTTLEDSGATFVTSGVAVNDWLLNDAGLVIGSITSLTETVITCADKMRTPSANTEGEVNLAGDFYRVARKASTGATFVWVSGLDSSMLSISEFVVLNGTTNASTAETYLRQLRMRVFTDKNSGIQAAIGDITSTALNDGTVSCQILTDKNQTLMAIYTIPADKIGYITRWWGSLSGKSSANVILQLRRGDLLGAGYVQHVNSLTGAGDTIMDVKPTVPLAIGGGTDLWMRANSDSNNVAVSAGFDLILVDT